MDSSSHIICLHYGFLGCCRDREHLNAVWRSRYHRLDMLEWLTCKGTPTRQAGSECQAGNRNCRVLQRLRLVFLMCIDDSFLADSESDMAIWG